MARLMLLGGVATLTILIVLLGSLAGLAPTLASSAGAVGVFALVVAVMTAVCGLGLAGRANGGTDGEPYW